MMQPHSPQLPTDAPTSPAPKNLKMGALLLLLAVIVGAAIIALVLPKKQVEANRAPIPTQQPATPNAQRAQAEAYKKPVH